MNQSYEFMIPKEKGHLKGKSMNLFYVILTALHPKKNEFTGKKGNTRRVLDKWENYRKKLKITGKNVYIPVQVD